MTKANNTNSLGNFTKLIIEIERKRSCWSRNGFNLHCAYGKKKRFHLMFDLCHENFDRCLWVNFFGRSHQCQLVMNGDLDMLFVIGSCPFDDIQFIEANENTLIYTNWSFRFKFPLDERNKNTRERESIRNQMIYCYYRNGYVIDCIVVMRSCGK